MVEFDNIDDLEEKEDADSEAGADIDEKLPCDYCSKDATKACFNCGKNGCAEHVLEIFVWKMKGKKKTKDKVKALCCIECLSIVDVVDDDEDDEDDWDDDEEDEDEEEWDEDDDDEDDDDEEDEDEEEFEDEFDEFIDDDDDDDDDDY